MNFELTQKIWFPKPTVLLAVLVVLFFVLFSPMFSEYADAQGFNASCDSLCSDGATAAEAEASCRAQGPGCASDPTVCIAQPGPCSGGAGTVLAKTAGGTVVKWFAEGVLKTLTEIIKFINIMLVWLVGIIAQVMDLAIGVSLAGLSGIEMITIGWEITRDIANIFFIFILLIIAIATILRLESYGAKQLLAKLIIVALLVNFSLVIAFAVVDAANILALTFIKRIYPVSEKVAHILEISKFDAVQLAARDGREIAFGEMVSAGWDNTLELFDQAPIGAPASLTMTESLGCNF
jgi:hypothetical protein